MTLEEFAWIAGGAGGLMTGVSAFLAFLTLRRYHRTFAADHDRKKRDLALALVLQWNQNTARHRRAIEKVFPGIVDKRNDGTSSEFTRQRAEEIYKANPEEPDWELRFHIVELLNYFGAISVAAQQGIADLEIVRSCFKGTLTNYYKALDNFIDVVQESRGYNPWDSYQQMVRDWQPKLAVRRSPEE